MSKNMRPPLGVEPREIWLASRADNLARAITDYINFDHANNISLIYKWSCELVQISGELQEITKKSNLPKP